MTTRHMMRLVKGGIPVNVADEGPLPISNASSDAVRLCRQGVTARKNGYFNSRLSLSAC